MESSKPKYGDRMMDLVKKTRHSQAAVMVGKKGVTPRLEEEIVRQLKKQKVIKIKFLKSVENIKDNIGETVKDLAGKCGANILEIRGLSAILVSKKIKTIKGKRKKQIEKEELK
ncbi:MAG: YhbY family RNA-binding protein [Candidatus Wukongarchaeota archaeon]|nr:YhbY family RNA-binding protein [Candidatus Wukongarchaeota archaeon]